MIRAILFDIGGVLLRTHDHSYRHNWDQKLGLPPGSVEHAVFNSDAGRAAQLGHITTPQLWQQIADRFELSALESKQLQRDFWAGDVLDEALVALIRRLHDGYKTAVISNYSDILPHLINDEWQIGDAFDLLTVSSLENVMKPDSEIYTRTLDKLNLPPEQTVFIDDFFHNIEGATHVGIHGIQFTEQLNLLDELDKLGVTLP